jgi:hypothetical protein
MVPHIHKNALGQVRSSSNASLLSLGLAFFQSTATTSARGELSRSSPVTSQKCQDITSNHAAAASFHLLPNLLLINQSFEAVFKLLTAFVYKLQNIRTKD